MTVDYSWIDPKNKQSATTTATPRPTPSPVASPNPQPTRTPTPRPTQTQQPSPQPTATEKPTASRPRPGISLDDPQYNPDPKPETITPNASGSSGAQSSDYFVPWPSSGPRTYASRRQDRLPPEKWTVGRADSAWLNFSVDDQNYITGLAQAMGRRSGSALWNDVVRASAYSSVTDNPRSPFDYLTDLGSQYSAGSGTAEATGSTAGRGRTAAYAGPVESIAVQAESDINASADAIAIELLGRGATKDEKDRILKRIRKAETSQPQVSTSTPGMNVTREGLTSQGREDILRQVLSKNPDFVDYQLDTTVMDFMLEDIDRGKRVANV